MTANEIADSEKDGLSVGSSETISEGPQTFEILNVEFVEVDYGEGMQQRILLTGTVIGSEKAGEMRLYIPQPKLVTDKTYIGQIYTVLVMDDLLQEGQTVFPLTDLPGQKIPVLAWKNDEGYMRLKWVSIHKTD